MELRVCHIYGLSSSKYESNLLELWNRLELDGHKEAALVNIREHKIDNNWESMALFSALNREKFVCIDIPKKTFYHYRNNVWEIDHGNAYLTIELIKYNAKKYSTSHLVRNIAISDIAMHMYDRNFTTKMGRYTAIDLCGMSFDYKSGKIRKGLSVDYTSISTSVKPGVDNIEILETILRNIFPDERIYAYFMRFCGSILVPGNKDKIFMVWSGSGNNGKSIIARLIELTLGDYAVKLPTSLLTGKRAVSSGATPELAMLDKKLVAFAQEPAAGERLNIGTVKELTGNDTIYVRDLYERPRNIEILSKFVYIVNSTSNMAMIEKATWSRIVVLPFTTQFVDNPKLANERLIDKNLGAKLKDYAPSFLSMLIDEARKYIKDGLPMSDPVIRATLATRNDNDYVYQFSQIPNMSRNYIAFVKYMEMHHKGQYVVPAKEFESRMASLIPGAILSPPMEQLTLVNTTSVEAVF
jgi:hypothetical protein